MKHLLIIAGILMLPVSVFAHAGDHAQETANHFIASPYHLIPIAIVMGVAIYYTLKKVYSKK